MPTDALSLGMVAEKSEAHGDFGLVSAVVFSPDGTKIVSGANDSTIKIWDSGTPTAQNRLSCQKLTLPALPYLVSIPERDRIDQCGLCSHERRLLAGWD